VTEWELVSGEDVESFIGEHPSRTKGLGVPRFFFWWGALSLVCSCLIDPTRHELTAKTAKGFKTDVLQCTPE